MRHALPCALSLLLASATAHAALEGRDLNGTPATAEAFYDTVLDITWLADANYFQTSGADTDGLADFGTLSTWASNLVIGSYVAWRLPKAAPADGVAYDIGSTTYDGSSDKGYNHSGAGNEMGYMFYVNLGNQAAYDTTGAPTACHPNNCLIQTGPFDGLMPGEYYIQQGSWWVPYFRMSDGGYYPDPNGSLQRRGWAVHDGDIGDAVVVVPEPRTWALLLTGLTLLAGVVRRSR